MSLVSTAHDLLRELNTQGVRGCLVGGLAVSVHCDPRFTRDVDLAVVVGSDSEAEKLAGWLMSKGFRISTLIEQEAADRLAIIRLTTIDGIEIDLLTASSGIESEIVAQAQTLEVVRGIQMPVARVGHLIALKLLAVAPGRETDMTDLRNLAKVASQADWEIASIAVDDITKRGYSRGRDLAFQLRSLRGGDNPS